jgi:hypothetical protein
MIPENSVPANPEDVKMAVRFPISSGLYHEPRIQWTPTKQDASKKPCESVSNGEDMRFL